MSNTIAIERLKSDGMIPEDSLVLSEHNNTVIMSETEQLVARIALQSAMLERDDPGDLIYSHKLSWNLNAAAGVLAPLAPEPLIHEETVISAYPLMQPVRWGHTSAEQIYRTVESFNSASTAGFQLRRMDIAEYAQNRIDQVVAQSVESRLEVDWVRDVLGKYCGSYPFHQLTTDSPGLVHGDLHTGNVVVDLEDNPLLIDLDSAAIGPVQYDIASWHVRSAQGDTAPTGAMLDIYKQSPEWNDESFRALMGWKVISSMTHALRYEKETNLPERINQLFRIATYIGAAGNWKDSHVTA